MRFSGTHKPGEHRLVSPNPPQIAVPNSVWTPPTEEEKKWKPKGAAAEEEEAGGILLPGLVGWALTAGPQQTLSEAGVVASGPLDLTNNNGVTFGAQGAVFGGEWPDYKRLTIARQSALDVNGADWALSFICQIPNLNFTYNHIYYGVPAEFAYQYHPYIGGDGNAAEVTQANENNATVTDVAFGAPPPVDTKMALLVYQTGGNVYISTNGGAASSVAAVGIRAPSVGFEPLLYIGSVPATFYGSDPQIKVLYMRLWKGDITAVVAAASWIANSGNGRLDIEIAAYAG
jgi:hypothetical protein